MGRPVLSQISVAPAVLSVESPSNVASIYVSNGYDSVKEVSVSFKFGYLSSDSSGNQFMVKDDIIASAEFGLDNHLTAFPLKFRLEPGGSQTVRVQVRGMGGKPEGTYWGRIIVSSNDALLYSAGNDAPGGIRTKINYILQHNLPVFYKKGKVSTHLVIKNVNAAVDDKKLKVLVSLARGGNSPFNGSVEARLFDSRLREAASVRQTAVVYFDRVQRIELDLSRAAIPAGDYILELLYQTKRSDIPASDLVQAEPLNYKVNVLIE